MQSREKALTDVLMKSLYAINLPRILTCVTADGTAECADGAELTRKQKNNKGYRRDEVLIGSRSKSK